MTNCMGEIILKDSSGGNIRITLKCPRQISSEEFRCEFEISFPTHNVKMHAAGINSYISIITAIQLIGVNVRQYGKIENFDLFGLDVDDIFPISKNMKESIYGKDTDLE